MKGVQAPPPMCGNVVPPFPSDAELARWRRGGPIPAANHCPNLACTQIGDEDGPIQFLCADCLAIYKRGCERDGCRVHVFPLDATRAQRAVP